MEKKIKECPFTGLSHVLPTDYKEYCKQARNYVEVLNEFGFVPIADYKYRENLKQKGHSMSRSDNPEYQMMGYIMVVYSHYSRSFAKAIDCGYWREHPKFDKYIAMVEYDNFPEELVDMIRERYGRVQGEIEPGKTYWEPKGKK